MLVCILGDGHDGSHQNKNGIGWSVDARTATGSDYLDDADDYTGDWSAWRERQDRMTAAATGPEPRTDAAVGR